MRRSQARVIVRSARHAARAQRGGDALGVDAAQRVDDALARARLDALPRARLPARAAARSLCGGRLG